LQIIKVHQLETDVSLTCAFTIKELITFCSYIQHTSINLTHKILRQEFPFITGCYQMSLTELWVHSFSSIFLNHGFMFMVISVLTVCEHQQGDIQQVSLHCVKVASRVVSCTCVANHCPDTCSESSEFRFLHE
jgi:hypothetical protein